jgi:uncharacterized radical SAM protein YgiQ
MTKEEADALFIGVPDIVLVSADAYVDHPSFGHAVIARAIESEGFSVCIVAQPACDADYGRFGAPKYGFFVSSGVVDSMVNNYTAAKKRRTDDVYAAGGRGGLRPDRAVDVYTKNLKRLFPGCAVIAGGIEPSLRRLSHYDYWTDGVRPSLLYTSGADLLIYGMGERTVKEILAAMRRGIPPQKIRHVKGTAYMDRPENLSKEVRGALTAGGGAGGVLLESHEAVCGDKKVFAACFRKQCAYTDGFAAPRLLQRQPDGYVAVVNPPQPPLTERELDEAAEYPYMRDAHPLYKQTGGVPAIEEVKFSVISQRGCFGSCSFCALNYHQGRRIQARSEESLLREAELLTRLPGFKGYIHDVGGPTANFHEKACKKQEKSGVCDGKYCIGGSPCKNLVVSHKKYLRLLQRMRAIPGVKKVFVRSGIRFDYLLMDTDPQFLNELLKYHVSGQLKVAPEHVSGRVLKLMNKPPHSVYEKFYDAFYAAGKRLKKDQYIVPYFISSHPGSELSDAIELALYLKKINYMPKQVQDFYPTPSTRSACMYYTGYDPDTMRKVFTAKTAEEKAMQRALLQYKKPENRALVEKALRAAGREDLIGRGAHCLIPPAESRFRKFDDRPAGGKR